jgi:hypothetical protein
MANPPKQNVACDAYPSPGAMAVKIPWIGDHFGPQNYQANGYSLTAFALGMSGFEWVEFTASSNSGNYLVSGILPGGAGNTEFRAVTYPYVTVQWFYAANGNQVANNTNLSAEQIRLFAIGI